VHPSVASSNPPAHSHPSPMLREAACFYQGIVFTSSPPFADKEHCMQPGFVRISSTSKAKGKGSLLAPSFAALVVQA
jgi:hypothetical protein